MPIDARGRVASGLLRRNVRRIPKNIEIAKAFALLDPGSTVHQDLVAPRFTGKYSVFAARNLEPSHGEGARNANLEW
jgi:hypothetical protein